MTVQGTGYPSDAIKSLVLSLSRPMLITFNPTVIQRFSPNSSIIGLKTDNSFSFVGITKSTE
jgi:hypothetical protein